MNPSMTYAQGVPGRTPGRAEGVLDTFRLLRVVESIGVLAPAKVLTPVEQKGLEAWFGDYAQWMQTAPTGKEERAAENNHGIWFDYQLATFALFARKPDLAKSVIAAAGKGRIDPQIEADGKMPRELARTKGLHYSYFALEPLVGMAELAPCVGVDLWGYKGPKGQGIRVAYDYLAPFVGNEKAFPYKDLKPEDATREALPLYDVAAWTYGDQNLAEKAALIAKQSPAAQSRLTIAPCGHSSSPAGGGGPEGRRGQRGAGPGGAPLNSRRRCPLSRSATAPPEGEHPTSATGRKPTCAQSPKTVSDCPVPKRRRPAMTQHRIYTTSFASVYPLYVAKAERKGRTRAEVDEILLWLTGFSAEAFEDQLARKTDFQTFFAEAPALNPAR
jgi:hypothetical protein